MHRSLFMETLPASSNPFVLMTSPEIVFAAIERVIEDRRDLP